jgi:hypothetical protein
MKYIRNIVIATLLLCSCQKPSEISEIYKCGSIKVENLEELKDIKNIFTVQIPKNWKTNLYYDETQSSIYTADTTKQLTKSLLLDITLINNNISFNDIFKLKREQENLAKKLIQTASKEINLLNKPSYYMISKGEKNEYQYQLFQVFIKIDDQKFILAKAEVYGDSLVNNRMCAAVSLIEKIKILPAVNL